LTGGRWLLGIVLLTSLLAYFWLCGVLETQTGAAGPQASWSVALFWAVIIAYIVPVIGYIGERTLTALEALGPLLAVDEDRAAAWRTRIYRKPLRWLLIVLAIGIGSGVTHNLVLFYDPAALVTESLWSPPTFASITGTALTWIVVTVSVATLLDNAILLARCARHARVDLLDTGRLRPFAAVAVSSTLAIIGAQAAFPIMGLAGDIDAVAFWPGLVATGVPMLALAALPVWPIHRRIAAAKHEALEAVRGQIRALPPADPRDGDTLRALNPLLTYRRELIAVSEWPFDVGVMTRLALYLVIPPLTWVGAALIENAVDALL
jgi:hypothetical protein